MIGVAVFDLSQRLRALRAPRQRHRGYLLHAGRLQHPRRLDAPGLATNPPPATPFNSELLERFRQHKRDSLEPTPHQPPPSTASFSNVSMATDTTASPQPLRQPRF